MNEIVHISVGASLADALAEELLLASQMLADLAFDLGADDHTLRRHMTSLQKIDHVTQIQLAVVDLLRHRDSERDPLATVTLADMAERLRLATTGADRPSAQ